MSSHLSKVTELNTGRGVIGTKVWVALAWVPRARVPPYLMGDPVWAFLGGRGGRAWIRGASREAGSATVCGVRYCDLLPHDPITSQRALLLIPSLCGVGATCDFSGDTFSL